LHSSAAGIAEKIISSGRGQSWANRGQQGPGDRPQLGPGFDLGKNTCQNGEKRGEMLLESINAFPQGRESEEIGIFPKNKITYPQA
jgi:hypothetical protein